MNTLERAIIYATEKHAGQTRKFGNTPYILHPTEVAAIISTLSDDLEIMAAGVLHDTVEDCNADPAEIRELFGPRVAALVQSETEDRFSDRPPAETWVERKQDSLLALEHTRDMAVRILWLGDKLSNMRSFYRQHLLQGDAMYQRLHQKDPAAHAWYYRSIAGMLKGLEDTAAYREYVELINKTFGEE